MSYAMIVIAKHHWNLLFPSVFSGVLLFQCVAFPGTEIFLRRIKTLEGKYLPVCGRENPDLIFFFD